MNPRVRTAIAINEKLIKVNFTNGEVGIFDVSKYFNIGIFTELKNIDVFNDFKVISGTLQWSNGADFCPDTIYLESSK